jgi:hypothetical protein
MIAIINSVIGPLLALYVRRELKGRVGKPNGQGTLVEMAEKLLAGQATQDERLGRLEGSMGHLQGRMTALEMSRVETYPRAVAHR